MTTEQTSTGHTSGDPTRERAGERHEEDEVEQPAARWEGLFKKRNPLVLLYTGNGKGKTSSALGVTMRAWGRGWKICWLQFIKSKTSNYGETRAAAAMGIEMIPLGDGFTWLSKDIEKDKALKAGFDDALMLDWKGDLAESTGANIFLVIDGTLVTPTPENFLDGITRRAVMSMAKKRGWSVEERTVKPQELGQASEVFLCGTAAEIVPVGSLDGHHYQAGPVARTLMADFQKLVRAPGCEGFGEATHLAPGHSLAA